VLVVAGEPGEQEGAPGDTAGQPCSWDPRHEIDERRLVRPQGFLRTLSWGSAPSAAIIFAEGLKAEAERRQPPGVADLA
jgi:hypothetical protein